MQPDTDSKNAEPSRNEKPKKPPSKSPTGQMPPYQKPIQPSFLGPLELFGCLLLCAWIGADISSRGILLRTHLHVSRF